MIDLLDNFDNYVEGTYYERFCTSIQRLDDEKIAVFGIEPSVLEYKLYDEIDSSQNFLNGQRVCFILPVMILDNMLLIMVILMEICLK